MNRISRSTFLCLHKGSWPTLGVLCHSRLTISYQLVIHCKVWWYFAASHHSCHSVVLRNATWAPLYVLCVSIRSQTSDNPSVPLKHDSHQVPLQALPIQAPNWTFLFALTYGNRRNRKLVSFWLSPTNYVTCNKHGRDCAGKCFSAPETCIYSNWQHKCLLLREEIVARKQIVEQADLLEPGCHISRSVCYSAIRRWV